MIKFIVPYKTHASNLRLESSPNFSGFRSTTDSLNSDSPTVVSVGPEVSAGGFPASEAEAPPISLFSGVQRQGSQRDPGNRQTY